MPALVCLICCCVDAAREGRIEGIDEERNTRWQRLAMQQKAMRSSCDATGLWYVMRIGHTMFNQQKESIVSSGKKETRARQGVLKEWHNDQHENTESGQDCHHPGELRCGREGSVCSTRRGKRYPEDAALS